MKTKVIATILGILICSAFLFATRVQAEPGWYTCTVQQVGHGWGTVYIMISDTRATPAFTEKWVRAPEMSKNHMLAVVLTAMTNDQTIMIYVDPSLTYPEVNAMYLKK